MKDADTWIGYKYFRIRLSLGDAATGSAWVKTMTNTLGFKLTVGCYKDLLTNQVSESAMSYSAIVN
jgi:hypothetical protein